MDTIIEAIKTALALVFTNYTIIHGEVLIPSDKMFPLIEIISQDTSFERLGTGSLSDNEFAIKIRYKNSVKKFVDENTQQTVVKHRQDAEKVMEERDTTSLQPKSTTILGVLLANMKLGGKSHSMNGFKIHYDVSSLNGSWITNADLTFNVLVKTPLA